MINVAFTLPYYKNWIGGYNYILNLMFALSNSNISNIRPILFIGDDLDPESIKPFMTINNITIVTDKSFNLLKKNNRLLIALFTGRDIIALRLFKKHDIHVAFETAQFYGKYFPIPIITWIPDFQHKYMPKRFSFFSYWKREIGFKFQTTSRKIIMLSSEDSRKDCEKYYPSSKNFTNVVHFAILNLKERFTVKNCEDLYSKYSISKKYFFLPNQYWTHKNHLCVIEALKLLKNKNLDITIVSTGNTNDPRNPNHFQEIKNKINSFGINNSFKILGLIPYEDMNMLLLNCIAIINPSFFEGWSTTVEEGKCTKTPMILSSIAVHKEQSGDNAFYFNPNSPQELADILEKYSSFSRKQLQELQNLINNDYDYNISSFVNSISTLVVKSAKH
jgi:glycosyltransferase involved in cell wall biosynthesis